MEFTTITVKLLTVTISIRLEARVSVRFSSHVHEDAFPCMVAGLELGLGRRVWNNGWLHFLAESVAEPFGWA